jgi:hypothetical protein
MSSALMDNKPAEKEFLFRLILLLILVKALFVKARVERVVVFAV